MSPVRIDANTVGTNNAIGRSAPSTKNGESFESQFQAELSKQSNVKLSAHAQRRFAERNVELGVEEQARLGAGIDRIQAKGADKSLVLMDDLALVVSARNRVVITAVDSTNAKDSVFTGIDSAVIV